MVSNVLSEKRKNTEGIQLADQSNLCVPNYSNPCQICVCRQNQKKVGVITRPGLGEIALFHKKKKTFPFTNLQGRIWSYLF